MTLSNTPTFKQRLTQLLVMTWAFFAVHSILRLATLSRDNAFGLPFVSKLEWYIFHAWAIDFLLLLISLLPFILLSIPNFSNKIWKGIQFLFGFFQVIILITAIIDQEVYRFLGGHLTKNILLTYGNASSLLETVAFISSDESIPFLGISFLILLPVSSILIYRWASQKNISLIKLVSTTLILGVLFWTYKEVIWRGGNRENKLKPGILVLYKSFILDKNLELTSKEFQSFSKEYQAHWSNSQGDQNWVFSDSTHPYYRQPLHLYCATNPDFPNCTQDYDNDGYVGKDDCSPLDSTSHISGIEIPSNGIDENCDGIDEKPWNVVFMILETHRAVFSGFLKEYGAFEDATPFLNSITPEATSWTHFNTSGIPTIAALMTTHLSILQHPNKYIASNFLTLNHTSFPKIMRDKGYQTHFFSAADPAWDNQVPWLEQWYKTYSYDRSRESDAKMYRHMASWMKDSIQEPFMLTSMTKVNHYPFNAIDEMDSYGQEFSLSERMVNTMTYTEESMKEFFEFAKTQKWFDRTLFVFMADHGFSLGVHPKEHGNGKVGSGLYSEYTWLPFVIYGKHPKLQPGLHIDSPAAQVDIGPTLLELMGIKEPNHFIGHNLLRDSASSLQESYSIKGDEGLYINSEHRIHFSTGKNPRPYGDEVFDANKDRNEQENLHPLNTVPFDSIQQFVTNQKLLNAYLVEQNRLLPKD